jgi:hypothetical protein
MIKLTSLQSIIEQDWYYIAALFMLAVTAFNVGFVIGLLITS